MNVSPLAVNQILQGNCIDLLQQIPDASVDLIFADPPYNLQLRNELRRPDTSLVDAVADEWDRFESFEAYDEFTRAWLSACRRVLKPAGTIWVIGSYHNIFRVGAIMQELGFWILNDVIWIKSNPMPNFRGVRFTNAHETLIWASMGQGQSYTFNHQAMKGLNDGKQMRSDWWLLPLAPPRERIRTENGAKGHSTQKPEALLYRVILSSSRPGDLVLDPFFGSGTTGAVARMLHRNWIGIEREARYIELAQKRIEAVDPLPLDRMSFDSGGRTSDRVPFPALLENGFVQPGQLLYFQRDSNRFAEIRPDGRLRTADGFIGRIHKTGSHYSGDSSCNGWESWFFKDGGMLLPLDDLRRRFRERMGE